MCSITPSSPATRELPPPGEAYHSTFEIGDYYEKVRNRRQLENEHDPQ